MRYSFVCLFFVFFVTFWCLTRSGTAEAAEGSAARYEIGKATVWAIADSKGDRDMGVYPDADKDTIAKYVPSGSTPSAIMVFLVKTGDETILLDAGLGAETSNLPAALKEIGVAPEDVTLILLTHMHGDHIGGLARGGAKAFPSARVLSSRVESDFWLDEESPRQFPNRKAGFDMAREILGLYGDAAQTFEFGATVSPGIQALDARGHTPGHTAFLLESDGKKFLFWGDLLHAAALQFPRPDINASYDMNKEEAAASRKFFMEKAAAEKLPIAGMHLPFPGVGEVGKNPEGGYTYKPF